MKSLILILLLSTVLDGAAQGANTVNPRDYASFKIVTERNIFNPNRSVQGADTPRTEQRVVKTESFALVGTMSYEKGKFAFFDGSSSDFRKVLSPSSSIAGYVIKDVGENGVKLERDGKFIELAVGQELRREGEGEWKVASTVGSYTASSGPGSNESSTSSNQSSSGGDNDVLKRLLEKRAKE